MRDSSIEAIVQLKAKLDDYAHASYASPGKDPFDHGTQVGRCWGLNEAIEVIKNALSAGDEADAKL
jgi:hypothetical protein